MNMKRHIIGLASVLLLLGGCSKVADRNFPSDQSGIPPGGRTQCIATVRQQADGTLFLQVDEKLRVTPLRDTQTYLFSHPYTRPYRLACELIVYSTRREDGSYDGAIVWDLPLQEGSVVAGEATIPDEGVDILDAWSTSLEDAFLTLTYAAWWGKTPVQHSLQLVTGINPDDPYEVRLVHSANGDSPDEKAEAYIAFDLNTLPPTEGSTLTLKWTTLAGEPAQRTFRFRSRE